MGGFQQYGYPKMDGESNGKALWKWMIGGENPLFLETPKSTVVWFCLIRRAEAADVADVASPAGSGPPMGLSR